MEVWLLEQVTTIGPIVAFFIWRDFKREQRMSQRICEMEDFVKTKLLTALQETTITINNNTEILGSTKDLLITLKDLLGRTGVLSRE